MRILLTGGAGFIGSACLVALLKRGDDVAVVDAFEDTLYDRHIKEANLRWARRHGRFDFHEVDLRNREAMTAVLRRAQPELVLHLGAVAGVRASIAKAPYYFDVNVTGTAQLFELSRAVGVKNYVLASSSSVYGGNTKAPFAEGDPVAHPISPYAASKRAMELMAHADQRIHGGHVTLLRLFTVYGPRQRPEMAFHKFMRLIHSGEAVPMFGDGSTGRDYTFIDDAVAGILAAAQHPDGYRIYNIGGDRVVRLNEAITAIGAVVGRTPKIAPRPQQPGDVALTWADLTRARAELGYNPTTALHTGLTAMWRWYSTQTASAAPSSIDPRGGVQ